MTAFERALSFTLHEEGGYVNDPRDPGGRTDGGIAERFHPDAWRDGKVTDEEKAEIYRRDYWDQLGCDRFPELVAIALFECGVNPGTGRAVEILQAALGVKTDGKIGPITLGLARSVPPLELALALVDVRTGYWLARSTPGEKPQYRDGWMNRSRALRAELLKGGT